MNGRTTCSVCDCSWPNESDQDREVMGHPACPICRATTTGLNPERCGSAGPGEDDKILSQA